MKKIKKVLHYLIALGGAIYYNFPSRKIKVIAVTGTKGKSSTVEMTAAILTAAGHKVVSSSTVQFKIGEKILENKLKMTMPGRAFLQKLLYQAVRAGCDYAVLEMSSQGAIQYRHKFINLDALIFTNLSPEHIEAHGSYENYVAAKLEIAKALEKSPKTNKILVVNRDDKEAEKFLQIKVANKITYSLRETPTYVLENKLPGKFNKYNLLAAATITKALGIDEKIITETVKNFSGVRGRMENVSDRDFAVIVDYAHTPDSLEKVYQAYEGRRRICVLGGTGGGRDKWKRPVMGELAAKYCEQIFLTNEDPYDEDPREIVEDVAKTIPTEKYQIIMDRREAMRKAFEIAKKDDVVIITGKGTDPYIMGPNNTKTPWDDARVAREELAKLDK